MTAEEIQKREALLETIELFLAECVLIGHSRFFAYSCGSCRSLYAIVSDNIDMQRLGKAWTCLTCSASTPGPGLSSVEPADVVLSACRSVLFPTLEPQLE